MWQVWQAIFRVDPLMGGTGMRVNFVRPVRGAGKEA